MNSKSVTRRSMRHHLLAAAVVVLVLVVGVGGWDTVVFPAQLVTGTSDPDRAAAMDSERKLFSLRKTARNGQKAQLSEPISQLEEEISGLTAQQNSKAKEIALVERELAGVRDLWSKNLVQLGRLTALEREAARLDGERGQLIASA